MLKPTVGEIQPDVLYRADEVCRRLGWNRRAFNAARRRGLDKVLHKYGKRNFCLGRDVIAHIIANSVNQDTTTN